MTAPDLMTTPRELESSENLAGIKSWGGRRAGAGRKKDPNSQRAWCEMLALSSYHMRQSRKVKAFDKAFGTRLLDRMRTGELKKPIHALRIMDLIIADWRGQGEPEDYDVPAACEEFGVRKTKAAR